MNKVSSKNIQNTRRFGDSRQTNQIIKNMIPPPIIVTVDENVTPTPPNSPVLVASNSISEKEKQREEFLSRFKK